MAACLNCGAPLQGPFCSGCGQRVIPPYPTLRELAGDAWHEFSGWDGRFVRTLRRLLHPGALTIEVLEGRRARYVSPLRLYLTASVFYFLVAALIPNVNQQAVVKLPGEEGPIDVTRPIPQEQRTAALAQLDHAPWWANALIRPMILDPQRVIAGFRETMPRALFVLVPVFAGVLSVFYRRRPFSQHLVFVLHLHAAVFLGLGIGRLGDAPRRPILAVVIGAGVLLGLAVYALLAFRRVYRESWMRVLFKSVGVGVLYLIALILAVVGTYAWVVLV
jgi:hypothetical protein